MRDKRSTRREFLARAAGGMVIAAPALASRWGFEAEGGAPPSQRLRIGHIGLGGRGSDLLRQSLGTPDVEVVAVCDVDAGHLERALKAAGGKAETASDYRKLLDRKDLDAVVVATPDHWHALVTIDACGSGKDVYVEKPLCTFRARKRRSPPAAGRSTCRGAPATSGTGSTR